jgi:hypothetical protein
MQDKLEKARTEETEEEEYRRQQRDREARLDERVDKLVSSIGGLIARIPPSALSR